MTPAGLFVGLATLDVIQRVTRLPGPNEKVTATQGWLAAGGPAANAAIAFAALGGRALLWTALGRSPAARLVAEDLAAAGVEVLDAAVRDFELAPSTVLLDQTCGDRAVVSGSGHVPEFGKILVPDLSDISVVLVDGHHDALARAAVLTAREPGRLDSQPVVVDAGSHKAVFDEVLPFASDVICSADYAGPKSWAPRELLHRGVELVAISHGDSPLEWWTSQDEGLIRPEAVETVDTLGAGDVLHGAYCFGLGSGLGRVEALSLAVRTASARVSHLGPLAWREALRHGR